MKPGYLHYCFFFLENRIHTSDWVGLFWLLCCLWKSVTNRECSSTISLYSIWPAPVARGNTPGIAFSFCLSYFLISQHFCRLSVLSATEAAQSPTAPASEAVCGGAVVAHSPFYTVVTIRLSGGNRDVRETCRRAGTSESVHPCREQMLRFLDIDWGQMNATTERERTVASEFMISSHFPDGTYRCHYLHMFDCMFSNPSCYLINLSIHHSPAGHRRWHLLPAITPMSPCCHPLPQLSLFDSLSVSPFLWSMFPNFGLIFFNVCVCVHVCVFVRWGEKWWKPSRENLINLFMKC